MEKIIVKNIQDGYAFLNTGEKIGIRKTTNGDSYIRLKNKRPHRPDYTYTNLIQDAIEDIFSGYGHTIMSDKPSCFFNISVVHFLDEEIGFKYKNKFMEDFHEVSFSYNIKILNKKSLHNSFLCEANIPMTFDSEQEAKDFITETMQRANILSKRFVQLTDSEKNEIAKNENIPFIVQFFATAINKKYENNFLQVVQNIKD